MKRLLSSLRIGQSAVISDIEIKEFNKKRHLLEMGLTKGTKIKIKKIAPMGDLISIELRGYELVLSKNEANKIIVS